MTKKQSSAKSRGRRSGSRTNASLPVLKEIRESVANNQTSSEPVVPDIILSRPNPKRVFVLEFSFTQSIVSSTIAETDGAINITLNTLSGFGQITALFDAYRIAGARTQFFPTSNTYSAVSTAPIFTVLDYDDANPTVISSLLPYDTLKVSPPSVFFERNYTPRLAKAVYQGTFVGFSQGTRWDWVDAASPGVIYYGLKYGVPLNAGGVSWTTVTTLLVECKSQR